MKRKMAVLMFVEYFSYSEYAGWFLYFTTHFKTRSLIFLARGSQFEYSAMLRLLTMLEKKVFKTLTVL